MTRPSTADDWNEHGLPGSVAVHGSAGLSYGQVAKILGCSKQAVHQCEQRALKKLRKKLVKPSNSD